MRRHQIVATSILISLMLVPTAEAGGGLFGRLGKNRRCHQKQRCDSASSSCKMSSPCQRQCVSPNTSTMLSDCGCSQLGSSAGVCMLEEELHPPQHPHRCLQRFERDYNCCVRLHSGQIRQACINMALRRYQYCRGDAGQVFEDCECGEPYNGCGPPPDPNSPARPAWENCYYNCGYQCTGYGY